MVERFRLLLAEDDFELRKWFCLVLRPLHCLISEASNGAELHSLLFGEPFDLVITDIRMPRRSGLEVAVMARQAGLTTPIILVTGYGDEKTAAAVAELGNAVLLSKPVDNLDLVALVRSLLPRPTPCHGDTPGESPGA